jgi:hypothetical protein
MDNFVVNYSLHVNNVGDKLTHSFHFSNHNNFYYWNTNIFNNILVDSNSYLRKCYKTPVTLCVLIFEYNYKNNSYKLISNINEIEFNPHSNDNLKNIKINKLFISGNKDILMVFKEI